MWRKSLSKSLLPGCCHVHSSRPTRAASSVYFDVNTIKSAPERTKYDAIVVGGGHNGLVAAAYLGKAGKRVAVFERRHLVGGAAVSEEIFPSFIFSRASYVLSLLRPVIVEELQLQKHGLKVYFRDPYSYTPIIGTKDYLLLGSDENMNRKEIAKFSQKDAEKYAQYENWLERLGASLDPLLDSAPINLSHIYSSSRKQRWKSWFESDVLVATLAADAVIGAMNSPYDTGTGYVLLHHGMGEIMGRRNAWAYPKGGMGAVSAAIARAALSHGVDIYTEQPVQRIIVEDNTVKGVVLENGGSVLADTVLSNTTPRVTYEQLLPEGTLSDDFQNLISSFNYESPVTKINDLSIVALSGLPNFTATPTSPCGSPGPHHQTTIHLNSESMDLTHQAYLDAKQGIWSRRPLIEMTIPSSLDPTLAPHGCHVASLFTQYTPYNLKHSQEGWTDRMKEEYTNLVFNCIEEYAPGFRDLVINYEVLTPPDLEQVFGLTGGNIFHGALSLDQIYATRPTYVNSTYTTPDIDGLYTCGSGAHPGGGVMGSPGRLAALTALKKN